MTNFKKLSAYTIAKNCCDITDIEAGKSELRQYSNDCDKENKTPVTSYWIRWYKLSEKETKLSKKQAKS